MKTESTGDPAAEINAEAWPAEPPSGAAVRAPGRGRVWPWMASGVVTIVALVAVLLVIHERLGDGSKIPSIAPVTLGSDGVPAQIDGQRVYRIGEQAEWQQLAGSFLLGVWPEYFAISCPPGYPPVADAASPDLVAFCAGYQLLPSSARTTGSGGTGGLSSAAAPRGSGVFGPWNGRLVIVRVHTHDPEATECSEVMRAACDMAVVAEEVVWPTVPPVFDGERVFRAADSATYGTLSRSFLFGGIVAYGDVPTSCEPSDESPAQQRLAPYCRSTSVDGELIAPASSLSAVGSSSVIGGSIVVVRAHVNDPLSAQCPSDVRSLCAGAIVVESVVWSYNPYTAPYAISSPTPAQVGPSVGPLGPDGVPTSIDGRPVHRGSGNSVLPSAASFLLGGRVARDGSCPTSPPSPNQNGASSSACSDWAVDGVPVSVVDGISPSLNGSLVVVDVVRSRVLSTCPTTSSSCRSHEVLVVIGLVWEQPSAQRTATPGASR